MEIAARMLGGGIRLGPRIGGQPGRQQDRAAVDGHIRHRRAQIVVAPAGLGQEFERFRDMAGRGRDQAAVVPCRRIFPFLAVPLVLLLGADEVGVGPPGLAHLQQDQATPAPGPGFPEEVPVPVQDRHHLVKV